MVRLLKRAQFDPYFTDRYDRAFWRRLIPEFLILAGSGRFSLRGLTRDLFYLLQWKADPRPERERFARKHPAHIGGFDGAAFYAGYIRALQVIQKILLILLMFQCF